MKRFLAGAAIAVAVIACGGEPPEPATPTPTATPTPVPLSVEKQNALIEIALDDAAEFRHWSDRYDEAQAKSDRAWTQVEDKMRPVLEHALERADQIENMGRLLQAEEFREDAIYRFNTSSLVQLAIRADEEWALIDERLADARATFNLSIQAIEEAGLMPLYIERLDAELEAGGD